MKRPRLALMLSLLASTALAQSVAPPAPTAAQETPIELNPFVIPAEVDNSCAAKDTLSGTRLRTDIKNVASSMSVITSEMMRDTGATSFYDVVDFLPSTFSQPLAQDRNTSKP